MTIKTCGYGLTDRPTDIANYRAAIAAKNIAPRKTYWQYPIIGLAASPPPSKVAIEYHLYDI